MSKYWEEFYKRFRITEPSDFAKFCKDKTTAHVLDLGCGNGRDTLYLCGVGIDAAAPDKYPLIKMDMEDFISNHRCSGQTAYMRWFLHSIPEKLEDKILKWCDGQVMIEARAKGDESFEKGHYRRLIDPDKLNKKLQKLGFKIDYIRVGYGMAIQGDNDPYLVRVIAHKEAHEQD